jgi:Sec-independent protein translocase protein TatA
MFGISGEEFLVILLVAIIVTPSKNWPTVARTFARFVKYVKNVLGKIQDNIDNIQTEIEKEVPLDQLSKKTMDDMMATFSSPVKPRKRAKK